jgi:4-amino-4-deoxy-L-arabinose transferase-like glycosyltransferase
VERNLESVVEPALQRSSDASYTLRYWPAFLAALGLLILGGAANVYFLIDHCPFALAGDEAHYWEWSRRLDWSYYSKGPLVAYIIAAGRYFLADASVRLVGSEMLAVRMPAILLSIVTGVGIFVLAVRAFGRPRVGLYAVLLTATVPLFSAGSFLMTIDAPLLCAWTWALVCVQRAIGGHGLRYWALAGALTAVGILAKYTMVLLIPALLLTWYLSPDARRRIRPKHLVILIGIALVGFVPILIWNARHDWVSLRHVAGQAGLAARLHLDGASTLEYLLAQALVTNPVWMIGIAAAALEWLRRIRARPAAVENSLSATWLISTAIVPWAVFFAFSFITKTQPNWPAPALISAIILLAEWGDRRLLAVAEGRRARIALAISGIALGIGAAVLARRTEWLTPVFRELARHAPAWDLTPAAKFDPASRLRGWSELAAIGPVLARLQADGADPFILADDYQLASEIAFYVPSHPTVYCAQSALGDRKSQYDIWTNPIRDAQQFIGRPCIYVGQLKRELAGDDRSPGPLPDLKKVLTVEHHVADLRYQLWSVFVCDRFAGFSKTSPHPERY